MEYIKAIEKDIDAVYELVQDTIKAIYPKYYPKEVVEFFCGHHCKENIAKDVLAGRVGIVMVDNVQVGTGCYEDNHITRVYVKPEYQGQGYGSFIMQCLETNIAKEYDTVMLDGSLPALHIYEKRGYKTIKHEKWKVANDVVLVYEVMEKKKSKLTEKDKVLTDPRKLMAVELKNKGIDIEKICVPQRVYLLADDIFDRMVNLECGEYKFPIGGKLWVLKDNPKEGFIKSMMCSPAIATQAEDLIACGVKELIHIGYAGGLQKEMNPGDVVITDGAYNDTAVARLYGFDYEIIETSNKLSTELQEMFIEKDASVLRGKTWTTDAGYHETVGQVQYYRNKNALCVEMEGVGLFTIAKYRECHASAVYIVSDVFEEEEWCLGWEEDTISNAVNTVLKTLIGSGVK